MMKGEAARPSAPRPPEPRPPTRRTSAAPCRMRASPTHPSSARAGSRWAGGRWSASPWRIPLATVSPSPRLVTLGPHLISSRGTCALNRRCHRHHPLPRKRRSASLTSQPASSASCRPSCTSCGSAIREMPRAGRSCSSISVSPRTQARPPPPHPTARTRAPAPGSFASSPRCPATARTLDVAGVRVASRALPTRPSWTLYAGEPPLVLRAFAKSDLLQPGESADVVLPLYPRDLSIWTPDAGAYMAASNSPYTPRTQPSRHISPL